MGGGKLVSGRREAASYPRLTPVPLSGGLWSTSQHGKNPVAMGCGGARNRLSIASFSQLTGHLKINTAFMCQGPFGAGLDDGMSEEGSV